MNERSGPRYSEALGCSHPGDKVTTTVGQLADLVHGNVVGDGELVIRAARLLRDAEEGDITFLDDADQEAAFEQSNAKAALVTAKLPTCTKALIQVADPRQAFAEILHHFRQKQHREPTGIHDGAVVHATARIGPDPSIDRLVVIGANCVIGARCRIDAGVIIGKNCRIGDDVTLHAKTVLYDDTVIGNRVTIGPRAAIGADGFGYRFRAGRHQKVLQLGNVVIADDVEIGPNSAVDRATFGSTCIGAGTRIGAQTQIAHNCRIGPNNIIGNQIGIGGSTSTGARVIMGDHAGVKDHMHIGDDTVLAPRTGVVQHVPPGAHMTWYPALEQHEADAILPLLSDLPGFEVELRQLLDRLELT